MATSKQNNLSIRDDGTDKALSDLKAKMNDQQRQDMAEIIQNEIIRRENLKDNNKSRQNTKGDSMNLQTYNRSKVSSSKMSNSLTQAELTEMYQDTDKNIQELRVKTLESKLNKAKNEAKKFGVPTLRARDSYKMPNLSFTNKLGNNVKGILFAVFFLSILGVRTFYSISSNSTLSVNNQTTSKANVESSKEDKVLLSSQSEGDLKPALNSNSRASLVDTKGALVGGDIPIDSDSVFENTKTKNSNTSDFNLQLDQRRVELEQRRLVLDEKEKELKIQMNLISEKTTELKSITAKLNNLRKEKDHQYEARLEQLASVYGSMSPNEAANLITKLDDDIALGLLERMPGKRMAQILGVMDQNRAIELTKVLTKSKKL